MLRLLADNETAIRRSGNARLVVETLLLRWAMLDRVVDLQAVLDGGTGRRGTGAGRSAPARHGTGARTAAPATQRSAGPAQLPLPLPAGACRSGGAELGAGTPSPGTP